MVESEPDEKLLVETAQRDPRCFADLYRMHFDRAYAYVARRVATRSNAQDLTAEVFQQALANLGRFERRGVPFAAWRKQSLRQEAFSRIARGSSTGWFQGIEDEASRDFRSAMHVVLIKSARV